jgi:hypothetical protein
MGPGASAIVPTGLRHFPVRNNYPDTVLDHDLANSNKAGALFVGIDGFLCDPQGVTPRSA